MAITIQTRQKPDWSVTLPGAPRMIGFFLGLCALAAVVKIAFDAYQENRRAWPGVVATITRQNV